MSETLETDRCPGESRDERLRARARFYERGETVRDWARRNGLSDSIVYKVLNGRLRAARGQAHRAAVLLGMKRGVVGDGD